MNKKKTLFANGKVLKVQIYEPQGTWASGIDFHAALRRALLRPPTAYPQVVDCLLPSPPVGDPLAEAETPQGVPELRWLGGRENHVQFFLHGRDPYASPPEVGTLIDTTEWLCFSVHVWSRPKPSPALVKELALARHPVVHGWAAQVFDAKEARKAAEEAITEELAAVAVPMLQRARVGVRHDGVIAVAGPGEARDIARRELRFLLAEVVGRSASDLHWDTVLPALTDAGLVIEGLTGTLADAGEQLLNDNVRPYLKGTTSTGTTLWHIGLGSGVRIVEEDPDGGDTGSLSASGSMASAILTEAMTTDTRTTSRELRRLAVSLSEYDSELVVNMVLDEDAKLVQVACDVTLSDAAELASVATLELGMVMQAVQLLAGLREAFSRQATLVPPSTVARGGATAWETVWLDPEAAEKVVGLPPPVRPTTLDRPDEVSSKRARASSAKDALDEINRRLKAEGVTATMTRIDGGSARTDAALAFAEAVAPSDSPSAPRWGRCHRCEEVLQVDEAQRLPPHDWRRSPCAGSGAQVALVDAPKPSKKKAKAEDTGGRVFVAPPAPALDAGDDLPWGQA